MVDPKQLVPPAKKKTKASKWNGHKITSRLGLIVFEAHCCSCWETSSQELIGSTCSSGDNWEDLLQG